MANGYSSSRRGQIEPTAPDFNASALLGAGIVVAGLYFSRDVLVPFVVAVVLSFVLAIPVRKLQVWGLGRTFPVAVVVLLAFVVIGAIAFVVASQLTELAGDLPRYQSTIRDKIATLKGAATGHGPLERLADMLQGLSEEFAGKPPAGEAPAKVGEATPQRPVQVEITNTRASPLATVLGFVTPILHPLATTGLVAVFTIFILLQRGDLRNRAIRLAGSHDLQRTTAAMNDAASRLSRLFLVQVLVNSAFGVIVGIGLWAIGVPSPILWGIMAALSRFIPYVGAVLAAGGPLILSAAVDPNWTMLALTAAFFICCEMLVGYVVEPLVYGHSTGLSPVAVIASVTFWTSLWGPVGLILATPLTVCLVVLGRHVDRLEFLDIMLGDRPPLTVAESFYQRVLASDAGEAIEQAELFLHDHALATYYDEVAIKGLALAQVDLTRGALDPSQLARIEDTVGQLIEDLSEHEHEVPDVDPKKAEVKRAAGDEDLDESLDQADQVSQGLPSIPAHRLAPEWQADGAVLCLAGRNELDRASALMLAQILEKHGLGTRTEGADALTSTGAASLLGASTRVVCLSYLDTSSPVHVRYAVRRIRRRLPGVTIIVGSWGLDAQAAQGLCDVARSDRCASRLIEAAQICLEAAHSVEPGRAADPRDPDESRPEGPAESRVQATAA